MDNEFWGYHLLIDAKEGDIKSITDPDHIRNFTKALVKAINMKAFGEPTIIDFAHANPRTGGITLVQLIETSSITCHFVKASGDMYLDVFSCLCYDANIVSELVIKWFKPKQITERFLTRQA